MRNQRHIRRDTFIVAQGGTVARILDGVDPGVLPIELPTTFEFRVNRITLADLGLTLPSDIASRVTQWID